MRLFQPAGRGRVRGDGPKRSGSKAIGIPHLLPSGIGWRRTVSGISEEGSKTLSQSCCRSDIHATDMLHSVTSDPIKITLQVWLNLRESGNIESSL